MNNQTKKILAILEALQKEGVDYVLIGGFAVVLHGYLRFTEGVELFMRNDQSNLEKLRTALKQVFKDQSIDEITVPEIEQYAVIRYGTTDEFYIDTIGNTGEVFSFDDVKSEEIDICGTKVRIATLESLYKLKEKTYRAVDQADLLFLAERIRNKTI